MLFFLSQSNIYEVMFSRSKSCPMVRPPENLINILNKPVSFICLSPLSSWLPRLPVSAVSLCTSSERGLRVLCGSVVRTRAPLYFPHQRPGEPLTPLEPSASSSLVLRAINPQLFTDSRGERAESAHPLPLPGAEGHKARGAHDCRDGPQVCSKLV